MNVILPIPRYQYTDGNGSPLVGGTVAFCEPGTGGNTFRAIFADEAGVVPLQNPCPLDASGIAYSGGSQVTVWGNGQYEQFVRDAHGNLMYSAVIDESDILSGGTINGDLTVTGNITTPGTLTAGLVLATAGSFQNLAAEEAAITALAVQNADIEIGVINQGSIGLLIGPMNANGQNITGAGTISAANAALTNANISDLGISGILDLAGNGIVNATSIDGGWPKILGGLGSTGSDGHVHITLSPGFASVCASAVACLVGGPNDVAASGPVTISVNNISTVGFDVYTEITSTTGSGGTGDGTSRPEGPEAGGPTGPAGRAALASVSPHSAVGIPMWFNWIAIGV